MIIINKFTLKGIIVSLFVISFFSVKSEAQTWEKITMNFPPQDTLLSHSELVFVNKNSGWIITSGTIDTSRPPREYRCKLLQTTDGGYNWTLKRNLGDYSTIYNSYSLDTNNIWFISAFGGLVFTTDGGIEWITSGVKDFYDGSGFYAFNFYDSYNGVAFSKYRWFTTDGGYTWAKGGDTTKPLPTPSDIDFVNDSLGWVVSAMGYALDAGCIMNTTDGGKTISVLDSITAPLLAVDFVDSLTGYAVGYSGYSTTDGGKSWDHMPGGEDVGFIDANNGWVSQGDGIIIRTTDGGKSWAYEAEGFDADFEKLIILEEDKVAYAFGPDKNGTTHTLLRADLSNITDVKESEENLPEKFRLEQNYPNPFNPFTTISYTIGKSQLSANSHVSLKVYDVLGNEIATLVNKEKPAGSYKVVFEAKEMPSGIYFYKLKAGGYSQTKKMILLR